jgi:adenylosuccinate synthase
MANAVIVGMQWGDEGKGKIVDLLCPAFDAVVRYQGGHNAGHTVRFGDRHFSLQLIPSGILHAGMSCVLGNGMVVAPDALLSELARLAEAGVDASGRLFLSNRAHILLPFHAELDRAREAARGEGKIGTTARGIGPAYQCKINRTGLRACDLAAPDLEDLLRIERVGIDLELRALGAEPLPAPAFYADLCRAWAERLAPSLRDTEQLLNGWIDEGRSLLFEGAQGTLLDVDHGTYPYVTSSSSTAGGAVTGTGVPPTRLAGALGVLKAYTTRVGGGPMVSELLDATGEFLRQRGNEYGTVTGRPRRCGWLDTVVARYARLVNGIDAIALTKLDVLDDLDEIPVCTGYRLRGKVVRDLPPGRADLAGAEPVLRTMKGWKRETVGILDHGDLPPAARDYVDLIEQEVGAPVALISTGPRREETIVRETPALARLTEGRLAKVVEQREPA